jgi:hypothetical protein
MAEKGDSFSRGRKKPVKVNITELKEMLKIYTKQMQGCLLETDSTFAVRVDGYPGIGKSAVMGQIAKELDFNFIDTRLAYKDNVDLAGHMIPNKEEKNAIFLKPEDIPTKENTIWFFDEFNRIMHPTILQTLFQIISNRQCGTHKLPKNVFIVIAGNLGDDDNTIVTEFDDSAFDGRTARFLLEPEFDEWCEWAEGSIHPLIVSFLKGNAEFYHRMKGRPWAQADEILRMFGAEAIDKLKSNDKIIRKFLESIIGSEPLNEFFHFAKEYDSVDEMDVILDFDNASKTLKDEQRERIFQLNEKLMKKLVQIEKKGPRGAKKDKGLVYTDDFNPDHLRNLCRYCLFLDADTGATMVSEFFTIFYILDLYTKLSREKKLGLEPAELEKLKNRYL